MAASCIHLLGVPIDAVTQTEALGIIRQMLERPGQHPSFAETQPVLPARPKLASEGGSGVEGAGRHIATPNNEMLVAARRHPVFRDVLRRTALNIPDSTGLLLMARLQGKHFPERVTGIDTMQLLCREIGTDHPVFLLGAAPGVAERAAERLSAGNPRLRIAGTYAGAPDESAAAEIIDRINASGAHLLFVAFGAPVQELWIDRHLKDLPAVRVAIGVGGAFDFLAGVRKRAPGWMRIVGLEWLWRVCRQPSRLPRIWRAVVVFPVLCILEGMHESSKK